MAQNQEELRPQTAAEPEACAGAPADEVTTAVEAERNRLREIDAIAGLYDPAAVEAAKYGSHPLTAAELALSQAQAAAQQGTAFAAAMREDAAQANKVPAAGEKPEDAPKPVTAEEKIAAEQAKIRDLLGKK